MPLNRRNQARWIDRLTENAMGFLTRAIDEFKEEPKYSVINFYTAVELFLKARLVHEHWSLIVLRDPDLVKFEKGDFVSVSFEGACERLQNIVQSPIPPEARRNFDAIRKHRNKMVHFFHDADRAPETESIALEQLRAWHDLRELLMVDWSPLFENFDEDFETIEKKLRGHREFLRAKFDKLSPSIRDDEDKEIQFRICGSCKFKAARVLPILGDLFESKCLVCNRKETWLEYTCPECDEVSPLHDGGQFKCPKCEHTDEMDAIVQNLNEFVATTDNYHLDARVPAHCAECEGYESVIGYKDQFMCVQCFEVTEDLYACEWCGELGNTEMEDSNMVGCTVCDGSLGHQMSKDD